MVTDADETAPPYAGPIAPQWQAAAKAKGFAITGRIRDRYHLALRCDVCGHVYEARIYTLMSAQPQCPACMIARLNQDATAAGLAHLGRDTDSRHYSHYRAPCGHSLRRQHEIVRRMAAGSTGLRCETCHAATEASEAQARGWELIGPDPQGDPNYRLYAHADGCGATQRIARANMQSNRFGCAGCGEGWMAAQSFLYAMRFTLPIGQELVKLGYSRDPDSRLLHQLQIDRDMPCEILRRVPMPTGHHAIRVEKRLHAKLRARHPHAVIDPLAYRGKIRVRSEIYDAALTQEVLALLDTVASGSLDG
ncbi:GIY-YIG nuclease family protein [Pseudotabrizicola alkalilacus]|uniref:GIY-YIG nuclease family protein n=2 Tax=Pseudotabrizicola alkalilacus TaxID=2305252 RepID=A0A411YWP6_9RHOB|nr:GIY-YIG nuclease family protein [Pseudotabrizicola alkalilacus]